MKCFVILMAVVISGLIFSSEKTQASQGVDVVRCGSFFGVNRRVERRQSRRSNRCGVFGRRC